MRALRIGLISPPWFAVPPPGYGGIERVVSGLAEGLTERGHEVTLFAAGTSVTRARLVSAYCEPPSTLLGDVPTEAFHVVHAYQRASEFDIIHDHTTLGLVAAPHAPVPVVHTVHGPVTDRFARLHSAVAPPVHLVAISHNQRGYLPSGVEATVIHNGVSPSEFPFRKSPGEYLLFVGRMNPEKGILDAIEIAKRTGKPLLILSKTNEAAERHYFESQVRPALRGVNAEVREQPPEHERLAAFRDAFATLFPVQWEEPFGLVMIESMATGTPVIAYRRGSVPEVIRDGVTGFIRDNLEEAVEAVHRVHQLNREACREHVRRHFSTGLNVLRHEELYQQIVDAQLRTTTGVDGLLDGRIAVRGSG